MNVTIRAQYLGLSLPRETAKQFSLKLTISLLVISMATASLILEETRPDLWKGQRTIHNTKVKARRVRTKIKMLFS